MRSRRTTFSTSYHRVVHEFANGDGHATEGHRIQRGAERREHEHRRHEAALEEGQDRRYNRSYVGAYTINSSATSEFKTVTLTGGTTGTWPTDNTRAAQIKWDIGSGSDHDGTAGAWQAGNKYRVSGHARLISTLNNYLRITGFQIEEGTVATPFEARDVGTELALCQRYAQIAQYGGTGFAETATKISLGLQFQTAMRTTATASVVGTMIMRDLTGTTTRTAVTPGAVTVAAISGDGAYVEFNPSSWTPANFSVGNLACLACSSGSNGILFSAEL